MRLRLQVERQGDVWVSPHDGSVSHVMVRRYVMQAQCSDASGECYLQFFNDQVAQQSTASCIIRSSPGMVGYGYGGGIGSVERCDAHVQRRLGDLLPPVFQ